MRKPSPHLGDGLVTHIERTEIDVERAEQWRNYCDALGRCGWSLVEVPAVDEHPDGVFIEDTAVMFGELAVITRRVPPNVGGNHWAR